MQVGPRRPAARDHPSPSIQLPRRQTKVIRQLFSAKNAGIPERDPQNKGRSSEVPADRLCSGKRLRLERGHVYVQPVGRSVQTLPHAQVGREASVFDLVADEMHATVDHRGVNVADSRA